MGPGPWVPLADPVFRLQVNLMVLLAELFMCFEVLKPDFVQVKDLPDGHGEAWPCVWGGGRVGRPGPALPSPLCCSRLPPGHRGPSPPEQQRQQVWFPCWVKTPWP